MGASRCRLVSGRGGFRPLRYSGESSQTTIWRFDTIVTYEHGSGKAKKITLTHGIVQRLRRTATQQRLHVGDVLLGAREQVADVVETDDVPRVFGALLVIV